MAVGYSLRALREKVAGKLLAAAQWLPFYLARQLRRTLNGQANIRPRHVYLCICDHFEPYWGGGQRSQAQRRIGRWLDEFPGIADQHRDSEGNRLQWTFFYPEEEYREADLNLLAGLCHSGYGEVEIHLHHDNDTAENLRRTLLDYKRRLHEHHDLLQVDMCSGEIMYGFIHGNWALCNSRPDGRWCGVNNELAILRETGCYADFTFPSYPSPTQTRTVNSIYYAVDRPDRPKSHDRGIDAQAGRSGEGLLLVQGPLTLDWGRRKYGIFPGIEYGALLSNFPPSPQRIRLWIDAGISVAGAPEHVFVKLYAHGAQEDVVRMLFDQGGIAAMCDAMKEYCDSNGIVWHYISAAGMVDVIKKLCSVRGDGRTT